MVARVGDGEQHGIRLNSVREGRMRFYAPHSSASVPTRHKHEQNMIIYLYITLMVRWDSGIQLHIKCARRSDGDTPDCLCRTHPGVSARTDV